MGDWARPTNFRSTKPFFVGEKGAHIWQKKQLTNMSEPSTAGFYFHFFLPIFSHLFTERTGLQLGHLHQTKFYLIALSQPTAC